MQTGKTGNSVLGHSPSTELCDSETGTQKETYAGKAHCFVEYPPINDGGGIEDLPERGVSLYAVRMVSGCVPLFGVHLANSVPKVEQDDGVAGETRALEG